MDSHLSWETTAEIPARHTFFSVFVDFNVDESQASCLCSEAEALQEYVIHPKTTPLITACELNHAGLFYLRNCKYKSPHINELFVTNVSVML